MEEEKVIADQPEGEAPMVDIGDDSASTSLEVLQKRYGPIEKWPESAQLVMAEAMIRQALDGLGKS